MSTARAQLAAAVDTVAHQQQPERVVLQDGIVRVDGFIETDPAVYRVLAKTAEPEQVLHTVLRVGAEATLVAQTDLEARVVERRFETMSANFGNLLDEAVGQFGELGSKLLDEDTGSLALILAKTRAGLEAALDETFDEDSKSSAIAKIQVVLDEAVRAMELKLRAVFDPDAPDGALAKTKRDILETVKDQGQALAKQLGELMVAVATTKARAEAAERSAVKGFDYEDLLHLGITSVAVFHQDVAERVGRTTGAGGNMHGDFVVQLNAEDTLGQEARFVWECKDRKLSMQKTMDELARSMANHSALAGIAVFSRQEFAPTPLPFWWSGNRAVLVYDKGAPDENALHLAYAWARWVCRRELTTDAQLLDVAQVEAAITKALQALQRHQTARSCLSAATNKINEGAAHLAALVSDVRSALSELWDQVGH